MAGRQAFFVLEIQTFFSGHGSMGGFVQIHPDFPPAAGSPTVRQREVLNFQQPENQAITVSPHSKSVSADESR
ncbi:MAG TPA: hypothetical protein PK981_07105 [Accumulibacter sp.]|nr:hypothetical protein [Accumulibacter sp.]HNI74547.1 hypothetical protein [Accumulibacter sp.]